MKAYLLTTGGLFAVLAVAHVARVIAEWPHHEDVVAFSAEAAIGVLAAALSLWAWRLLRRA